MSTCVLPSQRCARRQDQDQTSVLFSSRLGSRYFRGRGARGYTPSARWSSRRWRPAPISKGQPSTRLWNLALVAARNVSRVPNSSSASRSDRYGSVATIQTQRYIDEDGSYCAMQGLSCMIFRRSCERRSMQRMRALPSISPQELVRRAVQSWTIISTKGVSRFAFPKPTLGALSPAGLRAVMTQSTPTLCLLFVWHWQPTQARLLRSTIQAHLDSHTPSLCRWARSPFSNPIRAWSW